MSDRSGSFSRVLAIFAATAACTPASETVGSVQSATGTSSGSASAAPTSDSASADAGGSGVGSSSSQDASASGSSDDSVRFDLQPDDVLAIDCPTEFKGNATVSGTSPLGEVALMWGWFATEGGGKCDWSYIAWFLPSAAAGDDQLGASVDRVPELLRLSIALGESDPGATGEFAVHVEHWREGEVSEIDGTATIDMAGGPADVDARFVGSFVVDDPPWSVAGEFSAPWCDLLQSGPCGA